MANRNFSRVQALDKEIKIIHGQFAITGGTGGVSWTSANKAKSAGIKNIEQVNASTAPGEYKITLGSVGGEGVDKYPHIYGFFMSLQKSAAVGSTNGGALFQMKSQAVSTAGTVNILMTTSAGGAAHPAASDHFHFTLILKNSNVPGTGV
jgi:hypothetical protein